MSKTLFVDLRRRVVATMEAGAPPRAAAERFGAGVSPTIRWMRRLRRHGGLEADKRGGNFRSHRLDARRVPIPGWISARRGLTLAEVADHLAEAVGCRPSPGVVCRVFQLQRHGVTRKTEYAAVSKPAGAPWKI